MRNKTKKILPVILFMIVLILGISFGLFFYRKNLEKQVSQTAAEQPVSQSNDDTFFFNGAKYSYNKNLTNILFMGIDKYEDVVIQDTPGLGGQADCIMILSLNKETKQAQILQVSRDSMTDVDLYDTNGNYLTTVRSQLATQYAYGNGSQSSCWAMKKTVSKLLYDLPIDGYISMNLECIHILNDAVDGVTITFPEDYSDIDPAFNKGAQLTLTGEQAEKYVRYRDTTKDGTNDARMKRQVQYIPALISAVKNKMGNNTDYYEKFYPLLSSYMVTDMTGDMLNELGDYELDLDNIQYVPGEIKTGSKNEEYHVNDALLQELLIKVFYIQKK